MRYLGWYRSRILFLMENVCSMHRHLTVYGPHWLHGSQKKFRSRKKRRSNPECSKSISWWCNPKLQDSNKFCTWWEDHSGLSVFAGCTSKGSRQIFTYNRSTIRNVLIYDLCKHGKFVLCWCPHSERIWRWAYRYVYLHLCNELRGIGKWISKSVWSWCGQGKDSCKQNIFYYWAPNWNYCSSWKWKEATGRYWHWKVLGQYRIP